MFELGGIGDQLQELVTAVRATDGARVPAGDWVGLVEQTQAAMNVLAATQTVALAQLAATDEDLDEDGELVECYRGLGHHRLDAPDLVSGALGVTATAAAGRVETAVDLATRHRAVIEAMAAGRLDGWRAAVVSDELTGASPDACAQVLAMVGDRLGTEPAGLLRRRLRRVLAKVDADAVRAKATRARGERSLRRTAFGLGVDEWSATLPVEESRAAWSVVDTLARSYLREGRCTAIEQARADALMDLIHSRATGHVELQVTVPASLLAAEATETEAGVPAERSHGGPGDEAGEALVPVTGFGTTGVTHVRASWLARLAGASLGSGASVVACADRTGALVSLPVAAGLDRAGRRRAERTARRRLKRMARLKARLANAAGDHGTAGDGPTAGTDTEIHRIEPYRPPEWMVEFVKARDGACRFPGCTVAVRFCDLDHVTAWPAGPTHPDNLVCLCRRHHRVKQRPGWHAVLHPDGSMAWTDPRGTTRTTTPVDHLQLEHAPTVRTVPTPRPTARQAGAQAPGATAQPAETSTEVGAGLPSVLEEELEHWHDHHLIALACRPGNLTRRNREALHTGTRINTTRTAAELGASTRAGIQLAPPRRPMQLDLGAFPRGRSHGRTRSATPGPDEPPPF